MSNRKRRALISESLDEVLKPPASRRAEVLDQVLKDYRPASPVTQTSLVIEESLSTETRLTTEESLVKTEGQGLSQTSLATGTSLTIETSPEQGNLLELASSLSYGRGHTRLYHEFTDKVFSLLTAAEQLLYIHLDRYREGGGEVTIPVSWPTLEKRSGVSQSSLIRASKTLESKGLIRKVSLKLGKGKEQGNRFWVFSVTSLVREKSLTTQTSLVTGTTIKEKALKENLKRELAPPDYKNCPDCQGSGFWYPEGVEKGVAKCKHVKLAQNAG